MKNIRYIAVLLFIYSRVWGQEVVDMTLDECISSGLENNHLLKSQRYETEAAEAMYKESRAGLFPQLSFSGSYAKLSDVPPFSVYIPAPVPTAITVSDAIVNAYMLRFSVKQPLFTGFRTISMAKMNNKFASASKFDLMAASRSLEEQITELFWQIYKLQQSKIALQENIDLIEVHKKDIDNFYVQGIVSKDEVLMVDSRKASLIVKFIELENNIDILKINLASMIGTPIDKKINILPVFDSTAEETTYLGTDIQAALANRSEMKALSERIEAAKLAVKAAGGGYYPQIYLSGAYYYDRPNSRYMPAVDEFNDSWDVGIGLSLELWNWGKTKAQYQQAKSKYKSSLEKEQQLKNTIILDITQKYLKMNQLQNSISAAEIAVAAAEESRRITNDRFRLGMALNSQLLEAESNLWSAKTEYSNLLADYEISKVKYKLAIQR